VVVASSTIGRMIELGWAIGGEDLGVQPCDGLICSTPSGSTAYNLSNGGPVLVWGLDAMAITFVAPHSLHARPLVVPRGLELAVVNRTEDVSATVLVDGHRVDELGPGRQGRWSLRSSTACWRRCPRARSSPIPADLLDVAARSPEPRAQRIGTQSAHSPPPSRYRPNPLHPGARAGTSKGQRRTRTAV
jgi:hypothetical protein